MGLIKRYALNVLLLGASLVLTVVIADAALWVSPLRYTILPPHEPRAYLRFDADAGYDLSPNFKPETLRFSDGSFDVWTNAYGCFDEPYEGEKPFIYLTGDSFAWGWTPLEKKWGKHIESIIGTRVLTCGVNGYGTRQELIKSTKQLEIFGNPAALVVSYLGANDIDDDRIFPNHTVYKGYPVRSDMVCPQSDCSITEQTGSGIKDIKLWLSTHSVLYTMVQRSVYAPLLAYVRGAAATTTQVAVPESLPKVHTDAMLGFKELAAKKRTHLVVVLVPSKSDVREDVEYSNARMKQFLEDNDVAYVDLLPVFKAKEKLPERPLYWSVDGHWNEEGNRLAGLVVSKYLLEELFTEAATDSLRSSLNEELGK